MMIFFLKIIGRVEHFVENSLVIESSSVFFGKVDTGIKWLCGWFVMRIKCLYCGFVPQ